MKILKKKKKKFFFFFFFFEIGIFFFKLGKKSPKSHWERGRISAPEDTKKIPVGVHVLTIIQFCFYIFIFQISIQYSISYFVFVFCFCCFTSQVNSYGHCGTVSSPNHPFSWAGLNKRITSNSCTYFRL